MPQHAMQTIADDSPFNPGAEQAYLKWREEQLPYLNPRLSDLLVKIANPFALSATELSTISGCCDRFNMAVYQTGDTALADKSLVHALGKQFAMVNLDANLRSDEDSVSSLEVREQTGNQYIPYTNKPLSWHTDGYYNELDKQIYGIIMHCVRPAAEGGVNRLLNPASVYIALRDENPAYIEALMHPQAMTIPANLDAGELVRHAQAGPVFMVKADGRLHMRFSARKRNIIWRDTQETRDAVAMINEFMADDNNVLQVRLGAGQGIICNNVLHNRSGFTDSAIQKRLMYRARYYDAVSSTVNS